MNRTADSVASFSAMVPVLPRLPRHARAARPLTCLAPADRRGVGRQPLAVAVRQAGQKGRPLGLSADVCMTGMKVLRRGGARLPLEGFLLSFCLPGGRRLRVPAEVVFDRPGRPDEGPGRTQVTGLRFGALEAAAAAELRAFLEQMRAP